MFGHKWYWGLTRKYVSYFGTIFNDISIDRTIRGDTDIVQTLKVPITYAPKKKIITRYEQDPEIQKQSAITLPIMSFAIISFDYDSTRTLSNLQKYSAKHTTDADKLKYIHTAYPCDIHFELNIYVKNTEDGTKIIEQIMPWFKPDWTASVQLIPELGITMDIPIIRTGNSLDDQYQGGFGERQYLNYTYTFVMKAWYFGPAYEKKIIKFANTNFYIPVGNATVTSAVGNTDVMGTIRVSPGLDANGDPTSNSSLTVNQHTIFVDDDFGYITEVDDIILTEN